MYVFSVGAPHMVEADSKVYYEMCVTSALSVWRITAVRHHLLSRRH